jgi:hypothetical protein
LAATYRNLQQLVQPTASGCNFVKPQQTRRGMRAKATHAPPGPRKIKTVPILQFLNIAVKTLLRNGQKIPTLRRKWDNKVR